MHSAGETLPSNVSVMFHFMFHFWGFSVLAKNTEGKISKHARRKIKTCSKRFQNMLEEMRLKH